MLTHMDSDAGPLRGSSPRTTRLLAVFTALVLSATLAACGGKDKENDQKPDSQPVQGGAKLAALWPLTGEPVTGSTPQRPVLVTKIDNSPDSRPQIGLNKADLVTEELVEGGITRLAVFYYQKLPEVAGPVRSMRASDIGIVKPAHADIVASGAAPPTLARLRFNHINSSRIAPHNLMVHMKELASSLKGKKAVVPASYLPWGKDSDYKGVAKARTINATFSRSSTTSWAFKGGKYVNTNSNAAEGDRFSPDNVLVLRVREGDAGYLDPAGNKVPETLYFGKGPALLFHNGGLVRGTWTKKSRKHPVTLRTAAGTMKVPAGNTWIELVPVDKDGGKVTFGK
jgi:hypothetical protein